MKNIAKLSILIGSVILFLLLFLNLSQKNSPKITTNKPIKPLGEKHQVQPVSSVLVSKKQKTKLATNDLDRQKIKTTANDPIDFLTLPCAVTDKQINELMLEIEAKSIWRAQDKNIYNRPRFSKIRQELLSELTLEIDIDNATAQELATYAIGLRQKFWQAGGLLSEDSYTYAYKARLLLELAKHREPENLNIVDELVETIQAAWPAVTFDESTNQKTRNHDISKAILALRSSQFDKIKKDTLKNRDPDINDFIRAVDLGVIYSLYDNKKAKEVVKWLQLNAEKGDWTEYQPQLVNFADSLNKGNSYYCQLYIAKKKSEKQSFRFSRRLPSFLGPDTNKRDVVLWHTKYSYNQIACD